MADFSEKQIQEVWEKAKRIENLKEELKEIYRMDDAGAIIRRDKYGDVNSEYGWNIDYRLPISKGGFNHLTNLEPLHWKNNQSKADNYPAWKTVVSSRLIDNKCINIEAEKSWYYGIQMEIIRKI